MTWASIRETAAMLGVSTDTVRRRIRAGTLNARKHRGRWQIDVSDVRPEPEAVPAVVPDVVALRAENQRLREQLAMAHETIQHERTQATALARALDHFYHQAPAPLISLWPSHGTAARLADRWCVPWLGRPSGGSCRGY